VSNIEIVRRTIKQGSEEEIKYNSYITTHFANLHSDDLTIPNNIEKLTDDIALIFNNAWLRHSKEAKITKQSKEWWNQSCSDRLADYCTSGQLEDWRAYKHTIRAAKQSFFEKKIQEIATSNKCPWDLMN